MEADGRGLRYPGEDNRYWNNSARQNENIPEPHSFTDPYYLHPVFDGNSQDAPVVNRDSQTSNTSYMKVVDTVEDELTPRPKHFTGRTDPLPPIPRPRKSSADEDRPKNICTRPLIILIVILILLVVIAAVVLGVTLPIVLKGGASSPLSVNLCENYSHLYYPVVDIYPDNCGKYIYCVNGSEGEVRQCADGLEYAFNMTSDPTKVCAAPSELTYCERLRIAAAPTVTLDLPSYVAAVLNTHVVVECIVRNVRTVSQVTFLHDDTIVAIFNVSHRTVETMQPGASIVEQEVGGGFNVTLTLTNVTCGDAGRYSCLVNDSRGNVEKWTTVSVMRPPTLPTLEIPRLVEGLQNDPPVCKVASMGHTSVSSFSWFLNSSTASVRILSEEHLDSVCYEEANCYSHGESRLNAQIDTQWDKQSLCCRVQDPLQPHATPMETCQLLTIVPLMQITQNPVAVLGDTVNITCTIRDFNVTEVTFLTSGNNVLLTFYTNTSTVASNRTNMAMYVTHNDVTEWQAILNIRNVTCSQGGYYTCRALGKSGESHNKSTTLHLRRQPSAPTLGIHPVAETTTTQNPNCSADNLGYGPAMTFAWTLTRGDGSETTFSDSRVTSVSSSNPQTCTTSGSSVLDAQRYSGGSWNNSKLCCKLADPTTGQVVKEDCKMIYTLSADFCSAGQQELRSYPYDLCNVYVNCNLITKVVYFNFCTGTKMCFDPDTQACSRPMTP